MTDYNNILNRIRNIYNECCEEEQKVLLTILNEIKDNGVSSTYENIWLQDYKEIPVDKYTFLTDPQFLGNSNNCGKSIYPAWMNTMLELERTGNQYYEIALTGATRTGKTSTAVSDALYHLYRMMCLKNPQSYFGLKSVTTISIFFFNITQALAKSVAYKEFLQTIQTSDWFNAHGTWTKSSVQPVYVPEGDLIAIKYGSDASHALGEASCCVTGDTLILTEDGYQRIDTICGYQKVAQYDYSGRLHFIESNIQKTKEVTELIQIELEDGSIITGTADHKILLSNGTYKCLGDLTSLDDILAFDL